MQSEAVALKLISEIINPGLEYLYDLSNSSYKNNHIKQNVWWGVAESVGISSDNSKYILQIILLCSLQRRTRVANNLYPHYPSKYKMFLFLFWHKYINLFIY